MGFINETNEAYYEGDNVGGYQYVALIDIITNFEIMFTGEGKVIPKANRTEIMMHAKRAVQEFSYDVFRSNKAQEIELPPSLTMRLPQDYVNWIKISKIDNNGIELPLHPIRITSNPSAILQDNNGGYLYDGNEDLLLANNSVAWDRLQGVESNNEANERDYYANDYSLGGRYGLDPEFANNSSGFYIDDKTGLIHFTGNLVGSIVSLQYLSDGNATDEELVVHKFAEDAVYKYILYNIISLQANAQEYLVRRYKKSFQGAKRVAKIRLSNLKPGAMLQVLRGKSKQIKH